MDLSQVAYWVVTLVNGTLSSLRLHLRVGLVSSHQHLVHLLLVTLKKLHLLSVLKLGLENLVLHQVLLVQ